MSTHPQRQFQRSRLAGSKLLVSFFCCWMSVAALAGDKAKGNGNGTGPLPDVQTPRGGKGNSTASVASKPVNMKLLVLAATGTEPSLGALQVFLKQIGIPYDAVVLAPPDAAPVPLPSLSDGTTGYYQGIILTTGGLGVCNPTCQSALSAADWQTLDDYTVTFNVRTLSYYTFPEARYGLAWPSGLSVTSGAANLTADGAGVFPYLVATNSVSVANTWVYLATPVQAAGETTTAILSMSGYTVGATHRDAYGRESLALTIDNSSNLFHSMAFNYGLLSWVSKGIFLGSARAYLSPQVDDFLIADDLFTASNSACVPSGFALDPTFDPGRACPSTRMTGADLSTIATWQTGINSQTQTAKFRVTMAFNGVGTTSAGGASTNDSLTAAAKTYASNFFWVSHTWDHENLDCYEPVPNSGICTPATYAQSLAEISQNAAVGKQLFGNYFDAESMVTPNISGLGNPSFRQAAADSGLRYLVSDLSRLNPAPTANTGTLTGALLTIPRHATNIFYNVNSPITGANGSETDEYNYLFGPNGIYRLPDSSAFFSTTQSYDQIIDRESNNYLGYMLQYSAYPLMFHQSNLVRYGSKSSVFTDVINATLSKWKSLSNLPVLSLGQADIGRILKRRMDFDNSQVTATLIPGVSITLRNVNAASIPITGICQDAKNASCESYGTLRTTNVEMAAGSTITVAVR